MHLDRLRAVLALPSDGGWRAELAIDRSASPPRAVLLARVPPAVTGDALALSLLARGIDLATRVEHPALRRLLGSGELEGDLVLVECWREGSTLREALDAGGPLTPELASRVGVEVAGALQACQALPAAAGRPLCHGAVRAERILLGDDGAVLLCGMGRPFSEKASVADDLHDLARVLLESLPAPRDDAAVELGGLLDRVLAGEGYPSAAAFAEALARAVTPAEPSAVAARSEASQPEGTPAWLSRRRALAQALRAEEGASAAEAGPGPAPSAPVTAELVRLPELPAPATSPATAPPSSSTEPERDAEMPPPLPAVRVSLASGEAPAPRAARVRAVEQFFDSAPDLLEVAVEPAASAVAVAPPAGWADHPRAPVLVVAVGALLGLLLGLAVGGN